jgi:hypothetical protein
MFTFIKQNRTRKIYHLIFQQLEKHWEKATIKELEKGVAIPLAMHTTKTGKKRLIKALSVHTDGLQNKWIYCCYPFSSLKKIEDQINECSPGDESGIRILCEQQSPGKEQRIYLFCRQDKSPVTWRLNLLPATFGWYLYNLEGLKSGNSTITAICEDSAHLNYFVIAQRKG